DPDTPLAFSMEGYQGQPPSTLLTHYWAPHWNSVQALNKFQEEVGGPLRGDDPGRRLIEPPATDGVPYSADIPPAFEPRADQWLVVPLYHIFGSEALSVLSPGVAGLAPQPYLALNPQDAHNLGINAEDHATLRIDGAAYTVPVRLDLELARGVVGFPVGLPGLAAVILPGWGTVVKGSEP
ncbi:MAG: NADH-quinone oxidoreductase subunit G, partial [Anaerolineae bacterium]